MKKLSIHIGINHYDRDMYGEADLKQCVRDAQAMYELAGQLGFEGVLMTDYNASWNAYFDIMREYANQLEPGDTLLLTQSSHGTYWDTDKGRRTGLCMYDQVLWDFEQIQIWKWFKPGVKIIRVVDCCYAESNFRKIQTIMGRVRSVKLKSPPNIKPTSGSLRSAKATIISLASSSVKEVSYENEQGGVFTVALEQIFYDRTPTYKYLIDGCRNLIDAWGYPQTPKIETSKAGNYKTKPFGS